MPKIPFAASAYVEESYGLPQIVLENWYPEEAGDRSDWLYRMIPTPGLVELSTGGDKGRGCGQSDAVAGGEVLVVYGTAVKRVASDGTETAISGAVEDDGEPAVFAFSQGEAVLSSGGKVYTVTGSAVTEFTSNLTSAGASGPIIDIAVANNRVLFLEGGSGRVFYSDAGDADSIDGFFTAERNPDLVKSVISITGNVIILGAKTAEFWSPTDSTTAPFVQRNGYIYSYGAIGPRARTQVGDVAFWIAQDHTLQFWSGSRGEVSTPWLTRQMSDLTAAQKAQIRLTAHSWLDHQFIKLTLPGGASYFYDAKGRGAWHRRRDLASPRVETWGYDYFVEAFGSTYVQSTANGKLFRLDKSVFTEDGATVRRVASVLVPIETATRITNLIVEGQAGVGLDGVATQGVDPECMLRIAYDGERFGDELIRKIGKHGQRRWRPTFGQQGTLKPPVAKLEVAYSDPVGWTVYGLTYNERAY